MSFTDNRSINRVIEKWECHACGPGYPCVVEIHATDDALPDHLKGVGGRFRNRPCLCRERAPDWKPVVLQGQDGTPKQPRRRLTDALNFFSEAERLALWKEGGFSDSVIANVTKAVLDKLEQVASKQLAEKLEGGAA